MAEEEALVDLAATKLKRTIREGLPVDAAQVKVVGLEEVRAAAGANWGRMRQRIHSSAMHFLQKSLGPDDAIIPCGDGFLIVYAARENRNLEENCQQISAELNKFFIGEEGMQRLRAKVSGQKMPVEALGAALSDAGRKPARAPQVASYIPVWSASRNAFACYCLTPVHGLKRVAGYNPWFRDRGRHEACDFLTLDLQIVDDVIKAATQASVGAAPFHIGYSVHATTLLSNSSRRIYRDKIATIPQDLHRRLIARVAEIEPGTPAILLCDWVSLLQVRTPRVTLEFHSTDRNFDGLEASRACAAGFALPNVQEKNCCIGDHDLRVGTITRWRAALRRKSMNMFLDNVADRRDMLCAIKQQVDWISGPAVWAPVCHPGEATKTSSASPRTGGEPVNHQS